MNRTVPFVLILAITGCSSQVDVEKLKIQLEKDITKDLYQEVQNVNQHWEKELQREVRAVRVEMGRPGSTSSAGPRAGSRGSGAPLDLDSLLANPRFLDQVEVALAERKARAALKTLGVAVPAGPITSLDLTNTGVRERHLAALVGLKSLTRLTLSGPEILDEMMDYVVQLESLESLSLENCGLKNTGLAKICRSLPNLRVLNLRRTDVNDSGLASLKKLPKLEQALLMFLNITDNGLVHLSDMQQLRTIDLRGSTAISDDGIKHLEGLKNLKALKLRNVLVTNGAMPSIGKLTELKVLTLEDTQVDDDGISELTGLTKLIELDLTRTTVSDEGLSALTGMKELQTLNLRGINLSGYGLEHLKAAQKLEKLIVSETTMNDTGLEHVATLPALKELDLWQTQVSDLSYLSDAKHLESLNCEELFIGNDAIEHLKGVTSLRRLSLQSTNVDNDGMEFLVDLSNLTSLKVGFSGVDDDGAAIVRKAIPKCEVEL